MYVTLTHVSVRKLDNSSDTKSLSEKEHSGSYFVIQNKSNFPRHIVTTPMRTTTLRNSTIKNILTTRTGNMVPPDCSKKSGKLNAKPGNSNDSSGESDSAGHDSITDNRDGKKVEGNCGSDDDEKAEYLDYSRDRPELSNRNSNIGREVAAQTFPMKLHAILSNPEFSDIIAWLPHGRAWRILQTKAFEERAIPLYFRHGRYSSFARQVNGWGFRRITHGPDYNSYYHEMFLKGLPHLCERMKRLTSKDIKKLQKDDVTLPDFYSLSRDFPLPESSKNENSIHSQLKNPLITSLSSQNALVSALRPKQTHESQFETPTSMASFPLHAHGPSISALGADLRLQSSLSSNAQEQQQSGSNSHSTLLNALDLLNSQSRSIKSNANPVADQIRARNELLQRLINLSTGSGNTSTPLQSPLQAAQQASPSFANGGNGDLNAILLSLLNANKTNSQPVSSAFASPVPPTSMPANVQQRRGSPIASSVAVPSGPLNTNLLAFLGQPSTNPSNAGNLAQLLASKNGQGNTQAVDFFSALLSTSAASNQMSSNTQNDDPTRRELLRLQQQQQPEPALNRGGTVGNFDVAAILRQRAAKEQFKASSDLAASTIAELNKSVINTISGPPANDPLTNSSDLLTLLKLQQQQQNNEQQLSSNNYGTGNYNVQNGAQSNDRGSVDVNLLTNILSKQNAALLLKLQMQSYRDESSSHQSSHAGNQTQEFQTSASSGLHHQQGTLNSQVNLSADAGGNAGLQYLQQIIGMQASLENMNNLQQNNQLQAVLRLLANSNSQQQNQNPR